MMANGSVFLLCDLYCAFISRHLGLLVCLGWVLGLLGFYYSLKLPESPTWLVKRGSFIAAEESLQQIAFFNETKLNFTREEMHQYRRDTLVMQVGAPRPKEAYTSLNRRGSTDIEVANDDVKSGVAFYLSIPAIRTNLIIMGIAWLTAFL
jgi:hypothetical protein